MDNNNSLKKQLLFNGIVFYTSLIEMGKDLQEINYSLIKGEPLSMQAYGSFGNRNSHDIDILIDRKDINKLHKILNDHKFFQITRNLSRLEKIYANQSHQTFSYIRKIANNIVVIDVNIDIFWGEYEGEKLDISEFLKDTLEMNIYGFKAKVLNPMKALLALTLHHYKELNSLHHLARKDHPYKEKLFRDIYYLIKNNDSISIKSFYNVCNQYNIIHYAYFVLYYTNKFYKGNILNDYLEVFETPQGLQLLECYGLSNKERKKWKINFEERLKSDNIFCLIKDDLTQYDLHKINLQKKIFNNSNEQIGVIDYE